MATARTRKKTAPAAAAPSRRRARTVPPPDDPVKQYALDVVAGRIVAGHLAKLACQRHLDDLEKYADGGLYRWSWEEADRAIRFIEILRHYEGAFYGQNFILQPWQKFIIGSVFGWRRLDGTKRFREAYVSVGRWNGKTPLAAAVLIYTSECDSPREMAADCRIAAVDGGQAADIRDTVAAFINQIPELRARATSTKAAIRWHDTNSTIKIFNSNAKSIDGKRLHTVVLDELHEWPLKAADVLDKIETAMGKRRNPLTWEITTAGTERSHLWIRKDHNAVQILEGTFSAPTKFVFIGRMDKGDDPMDPAIWPKANPNYGVSVNREYIEEQANKARQDPVEMSKFLRYHMNVQARSPDKLIDPDEWANCEGPPPPLKNQIVHGGLDLGWRNDLMALYWSFPTTVRGQPGYAVHGKCWCPEEGRRPLSAEPWFSWIKRGHLIVTPGDTTDPEAVTAEILRVRKIAQIGSIAYDGNQDRMLGTTLLNHYGIQVFDFYQSCTKYNEPFRRLLVLLKEKRIIFHCPILKWAADNVIAKQDAAGRIMPDKQKSIEKIDPFVAMLMSLSECLFAQANPSPYANHPLLTS